MKTTLLGMLAVLMVTFAHGARAADGADERAASPSCDPSAQAGPSATRPERGPCSTPTPRGEAYENESGSAAGEPTLQQAPSSMQSPTPTPDEGQQEAQREFLQKIWTQP